jgi:hypothetical protein
MSAVAVDVVLIAGELHQLLTGGHLRKHAIELERLRVKLRIFHRHFVRQMRLIRARPAFDNMHGVAVRMGIVIEPRELVFESD